MDLESGNLAAAAEHFALAERFALAAGQSEVLVKARVGRALALQSGGQVQQARALLLETLPIAEGSGDHRLMARVRRGMVMLLSWTGPAGEAREHAAAALEHARASGDAEISWSVHWTLAVMAGLSGDSAGVAEHQGAAERLAMELQSPVLLARTAEVGVEYAAATGQWGNGLELADRTIPVARAVAPRTLLPRLLVWSGLMLLERDEGARAQAHFAESWELSEAGASGSDLRDPHSVIPACIGMATWHMKRHEFEPAAALGERALAIADRLGVVAWGIHRLLPILIESHIWLKAFARAAELTERLHEQSKAFGHPLGLASAAAARALLRRFRDGDPRAHEALLAAAEQMEAIPFLFPAGRLRLNAAQLLYADGDRDGATRELRLAHACFERLGATRELRITRGRMREFGVRVPGLGVIAGGELTAREAAIAALIVQRKSNKEIGVALDLATRTVGSHLEKMFVKLGVRSRGELADRVRGMG